MKQAKSLVLYADDDDDDRLFMEEAITRLNDGFRLVEVKDGKEAIEKLQQLNEDNKTPCLIILDGNMPILNGEEALEIIRNEKKWDSIPICIFSTSPRARFSTLVEKYDVKVYSK